MRPIAIVTAAVLLGVFPSPTASQTRSQLESSERPYQPPPAFQPAAAYQPPPAFQPPTSHEPAPANLVMPSSHATPPASTAMAPKKKRTAGMKLGASRKGKNKKQSYDGRGGLPSLVTITSSLALVVGLFLVVAFLMRRATPPANSALPDEVVEVLGRAPLANRQQVHLLRCGNKLLLVCVTPNGTETLTEITEAAEVDRLAALCRQNNNGSATANFRQVFQQLSWSNTDPSEKKGGRT